ncbi:hypothetical protein BT69DRAFT_1344922 [Atractiella rhizophila]|nr:hypothetical protein BT69DRAFT_1344922 [Atractiella rhizophila]
MLNKQLGFSTKIVEEATENPKEKGRDKDSSEKKSLENVALACDEEGWSEAESEATHISANEESNWDIEQPQPLLVQGTGIIKWLKWSVRDKIVKFSKGLSADTWTMEDIPQGFTETLEAKGSESSPAHDQYDMLDSTNKTLQHALRL